MGREVITKKGVSELIKGLPRKITVGDPLYFEQFEKDKLKGLVYNKSYRGKADWVGKVLTKEVVSEYEVGECKFDCTLVDYRVLFAENEEYLNLLLEDRIYKSDREKVTRIGVDSAKYILEIDDKLQTIRTGGDGYFGAVIEYSKKNKLRGLSIDLNIGDNINYEETVNILEYMFNTKINSL